MKQLVDSENWNFEADTNKKNFKNSKHRVLYFLWQKFGWRPFEYRNYKKIRLKEHKQFIRCNIIT
jgi:hypothetical protein